MNSKLIILPTLNEAKNVKKLFVLLKKMRLNLKYLFIDHGSNDGTQEILKEIKKRNKQKVFIIQKKIGKA